MSLINYRQDIQVIRGIAVLFVVLYHLKMPGFSNGLLGVDIFFVVSGYLMAQLFDKRSPADFILARLNRLLPAYIVVTLLTLVASYFIVVASDYTQVTDQSVMGAFFLSNFYYWNQSSYFLSQDFNPLLNYWSLAVEVQFYLLVPFLFPLLRRYRGLAVSVFGVSLCICLIILTKSEKTAFFMLPTRIWEFMLGAFAAWYGEKAYGRFGLAGGGLVLALLAVIFFFPLSQGTTDLLTSHPSIAALLVTVLTAGVLTMGLPKAFELNFVGRSLTKLGDLSYSVYLVHFPVIVLVNYVPFGGTVLGYSDFVGLILILGLTFVLAIPLYAFVEKGRRFRLERLAIGLPVFFVLAGVAVGSGYLKMMRLDPVERNIFLALDDNNQRRCPFSFRILHPTERLCLYGPTNAQQSIALIGDSHAVSIRDQVVKQAGTRGYKLYFSVPNLPLLDNRFPISGMDVQLDDPDLRAVILHYKTTKFDKPANRDRLQAFIERSVERGVPVIVIAPIPIYSEIIPRFMHAALSEDRAYDGLQFSRADSKARDAAFWGFVTDLPQTGVRVVDPTDLLCPDGPCRYFGEDLRPYYYDDHHLTLTGAATLAPEIDAILDMIDTETTSRPKL